MVVGDNSFKPLGFLAPKNYVSLTPSDYNRAVIFRVYNPATH